MQTTFRNSWQPKARECEKTIKLATNFYFGELFLMCWKLNTKFCAKLADYVRKFAAADGWSVRSEVPGEERECKYCQYVAPGLAEEQGLDLGSARN